MNILRYKSWTSDNNLWMVCGRVRKYGEIETCEVIVYELKNNRYEYYYGKKTPAYVEKKRKEIYRELI